MSRDFQLPGRSPVVACNGMAATSHPLATLAAIDILRAGGTAADAAVAAVAVLCVVEPHMTGIGGDCFTLISKPGKPVWGYNGCGRAGAAASAEALRSQGMAEIGNSIHAVTVPGAIAAWEDILKDHGRFGLDRVLQQAIQYAEGGFPVAARVAWDWQRHVGKLSADPSAAKHYLFDGKAPKEGDVIRFPALAETLKTIAAKGAKGFYEGAIGEEMAATVAARGSFLTAEDFANHRGEVVTPIATHYRGLDLLEIPPNGQGITALVMLNILENFDLAALDPLRPRALPPGAGGRAARLRGARQPYRRTRVHARRRARPARQGLRQEARRPHRHEQARRAAERADAGQRHGLSHRGRPRPHGLLLHQLALFELRRRPLHREDRHPAHQPRRLLHARSRPSQRASGRTSGRCTPSSRRWP